MKVEVINVVIIDNVVRISSPFPTEKAIQILKDILSSETIIKQEEIQ